jgi:hypothetical protein
LKTCSKCKVQKPFESFHKLTRAKDGHKPACKQCLVPLNKAYNDKKLADPIKLAIHRERSKARVATPEGRKKHREANLRYAKTHPNGSYAKQINDSLFKLTLNFRRLVSVNLKSARIVKRSKTQSMLGCDYEFLHLYLEMQFQPEMSWDNFGEWEIDHKIPISSAKTEDELLALNNFKNLQPLWGKYNRMKKNATPEQWKQYIKLNNINTGVRP